MRWPALFRFRTAKIRDDFADKLTNGDCFVPPELKVGRIPFGDRAGVPSGSSPSVSSKAAHPLRGEG